MKTENDVYEHALCEHLQVMAYRLRRIPADKWDWTPAACAPSPGTIGRHALVWLRCDRQHILEPDCTLHERISEPDGQDEICEALAEETEAWRVLLRGLTLEKLAEPRRQFGTMAVNVRWFIYHMIQHVIYKSGQLAEIYFALGLDGEEPYDAPWPNTGYEQLEQTRRDPLLRAIIDGDLSAIEASIRGGADVNAPDNDGDTPLKLAVCLNAPEMVALLLEKGAESDRPDAGGVTPVRWSDYLGFDEISRRLRAVQGE